VSAVGLRSALRAERRKLAAQAPVRALALVCLFGPLAFAVVLRLQGGVPGDALFGVWVHSSGFAVSLVLLAFAGNWGFPVIAGVLAGDLFSQEDRLGTWKTVLTRSRTRAELFAGKVLAALAFAIALAALAAIASLVAGMIVAGDRSLVGLGGTLMSPAACLGLVLASWLACVPGLLAFTGVAVVFSVATRNGIVGVLGPLLVALAMQLLALIGNGTVVHLLLISSAFDGWHGLFAAPAFFGPLMLVTLVSCVWLAACLLGSWLIVRGRDFAGPPVARRSGWVAAVRAAAGSAALLALLALAAGWGPAAVTSARLRSALSATFNRLTVLQQRQLGRSIPTGAHLTIVSSCSRRAGQSTGPGDWICTLDVFIPQPGSIPFQQTAITYDVSVQSDGCYKAQAPASLVGQQTLSAPDGRSFVNPVFTIYGCFDVV
jgi:ABC-2 type transport system permease protein